MWLVGACTAVLLILAAAALTYGMLFGAPRPEAKLEQFTVPFGAGASARDTAVAALKTQGFIRSETGFRFALGSAEIAPGAYQLSKNMSAWEIAAAIKRGPALKWVVIPEGWRKEQIAELLAGTLGWTEQQRNSWVETGTAAAFDETEGVYFPDSYLIPVDDTPEAVAVRLRTHFQEVFAPYADEALKQNIKWTTLLKIASIIQREAAGKDDMPIISGVIWNRLLAGQKLDVDATVQYARDTQRAYAQNPCEDPKSDARTSKNGICTNPAVPQPRVEYRGMQDWWAPLGAGDKNIDSLYNTYLYKGLPPHPIAEPGLDAIKAALFPADTACFYYLHDRDGNIHCSATYEEHQRNVAKYLS